MALRSVVALCVLMLVSLCGSQSLRAEAQSSKGISGKSSMSTISVAELTASDGAAGDALGTAVAMSRNTVVVGEYCEISGCNTSYIGAVYVYQAQNRWETMTQTAELTPSDGFLGDGFGQSVAIEGNTIVVGSIGKVYVFVSSNGTWSNMTETAQLTNGVSGDDFGASVGICNGAIVVGAPNAAINGNQSQGAAYVFVEPQSGWKTTSVPTAELLASDGTFQNLFGLSVEISRDTIVVGSPFHNDQTGPGEAYVFVKSTTGWVSGTEKAILTRSPQGPYDEFGFSVSISANTIAVGASQAVGKNNGQGTVDIFEKPTGGWVDATENAELVSPVFIQHFGFSVGIRGKVLVVGTFSPNNLIFVFIEPETGWRSSVKPQAQLMAGNGVSFFGFSVATSGNAVVGGAPFETVNGNINQGAAYVFTK